MNNTGKITIWISKIIGSLMTIAFSFIAFAHGINCTLLPWFSPSTLTNGVSRIAYEIPEASYTKSCAQAMGSITCDNGVVTNGNIYKYPSCITHEWDDCTTPVMADHLQYKTLYKSAQSNYTQSCLALSQSLQCLDWVFTWWVNSQLYTFASCEDTNLAQCIDTRTNSYRDHGETIFGYTASSPGIWATCETMKKTLQCVNGNWSGGNQNSLVPSCTNPSIFASCINPRTNIVATHTTALYAYTSPSGDCTNIQRILTCVNGARSGYTATLSSSCVDTTTLPCLLSEIGMGSWTRPHGAFVTKYTQWLAFQNAGYSCDDYTTRLQCVNGNWSGTNTAFTGCQTVISGSCRDAHTTTWKSPYTTIYRYTQSQPSVDTWCADFRLQYVCINGNWTGSGMTGETTPLFNSWYSPTCGDCVLPRWLILPELATTYGYSSVLWSMTGIMYTGWCSPFSGQMICQNSVLQWTWWVGWAFAPSNYPYSFAACNAGTPRSCTQRAWGTIAHWTSKTWYSNQTATLPKSCEQNYAETLTCINGSLNGNRQTYKYSSCSWETLTPGVDISINESKGIIWQEALQTGIIAQRSSPEIHILFKNKGDTDLNQAISQSGFLECIWGEKNITVYTSNPITSFVVNSWSKLWVNIRINAIFTQALGNKTLICSITPSMILAGGDSRTNNIRTGVFEVVEADRFDLALSRSISSISKNIDAAEWAKGTDWLQNFVFNNLMNVLVPLIIIVGILSAILWFYKIMFSSDDKAVSEWAKYIIFGVVGIIVIMSAKFIGQNVYDLLSVQNIEWYSIATWLYDKIVYPFIKFAIYLVLWAMFILLLTRVITFLFGSDSDAIKKSGTMIAWNVISMLIIIGAKQIVEFVYGKQAQVLNEYATNLGEIGSGILADKNLPILYQIINYALGIASFVVLIIIIIQTIKLLMKPDDPAQIKNITKSFLYIFIGILVIGAGYLIVNFAIIN